MSSQPHNYTNGYSPWQKVAAETAGFIPAEFVSMGVSLGVVALADTVAPDLIKSVSKAVGKAVFEPYLENYEWGLSKVCKLEECQVDTTKSRDERAEALAHTTLVFGAAWVASMIAKIATRRSLNKLFQVNGEDPSIKKNKWRMDTHEKIIFGMDEGVHYGSLLFMNTAGASVTDDMIGASKNILVKLGVPEKKAHEISAMAVIWELPNMLGLVAGISGIMGIHHRQWDKKLDNWLAKKPAGHVDRLAMESAADTLGILRS